MWFADSLIGPAGKGWPRITRMPRIRAGWFLPVAGTHRMRPQNQTREGLQIVHGGAAHLLGVGLVGIDEHNASSI